jgi:ribosome biogenesis GTPase / thiamine phosphate phosphatase
MPFSSLPATSLFLEVYLIHEQQEDPDQDLSHLGWTRFFAERFGPHAIDGLIPGRVAVEHKGAYIVLTGYEEVRAQISGRFRYEADSRADLPAVGDWVALEPTQSGEGIVRAVLERRSKFMRNVAGERVEEQVLAANIDVSFLVAPIDEPVNLRRLERYMTMAWGGGTDPVVVLTKADLSDDVGSRIVEVESAAIGLPVHAVDALSEEEVGALRSYLAGDRTAVFLGSSGVGKSTLVNSLLGSDRQSTNEVRWDHKGRHTTSRRELITLPGGGLIIDTPGMREIQLWDAGDGLSDAFEDIAELTTDCRFNDCSHRSEPGCAVRAALEQGPLETSRWESYVKLQRELRWLETKRDVRAKAEQKRKHRAVNKAFRQANKRRAAR